MGVVRTPRGRAINAPLVRGRRARGRRSPSPATEGSQGGPLTTTLGPESTISSPVAATTNFWPSTLTFRAASADAPAARASTRTRTIVNGLGSDG